MEQLFIYSGLGALVWIFLDIMKRGKKPETSPPAAEPETQPTPPEDMQRLFRTITTVPGNNPDYISATREINRIARMYDAMKQPGAPAFFDLPDAQIIAIIQRYKGGAA